MCAICQENIIESGNTFHTTCALEWYRRSEADVGCPICRSQCQTYSSRKYRIKLYKKISKSA